ncbi:vitelline membrane outer layer protein 1 homolog isoform X2 [Labeo rohita]|uniref:vitelline membrane outer layer protein 1 homolog isoform X2 n=1 Tax=Labeo rohita TaxID=84645 RepID=UPI0021E1D8E7|nr:vitelline membrane outer layer protein 1 homolog isoform X2 [Labeo rohita]
MHHFISMMFSLLVITGLQVSVESAGRRLERSTNRLYTTELSVPNGGGWGTWGNREMCPFGTYAAGFSLKVEGHVGDGDDTALNGIRLHCIGLLRSYHNYASVQSVVGRFTCSDRSVLTGDGTGWGDWGRWSQSCVGKGICGIKTRVEGSQGSGDDTALNDVRMYCCK